MNNYDKLRLAIYEKAENNEITNEEKNLLLEKVNESNEIYIKSFITCVKKVNTIKKDIRQYIKDENYPRAYKEINNCKKELQDLRNLVEKVPSTMTDTMISKCASMMKTIGLSVLSYEVKTFIANKTTFKNQDTKSSYKLQIEPIAKTAIAGIMTKNAIMKAKGIDTKIDGNTFKQSAISLISDQLLVLNRLERQVKTVESKK